MSKPPTDPTKTLAPSIATLALSGVRRVYKKGSILLNEGDSGDTIVILLEGSVRVYGTDGQGREVTYGNIVAPSYFGEMSLDGGPRSASVEAITPCTCAVVTRERVRHQLAQDPDLAMELIHKIIYRARNATNTVRSMALLDAYGRLRETLESLTTPAENNTPSTTGPQATQAPRRIQPGTTHAALAQRIGTSREMVSKILRDLEKGGYLLSEGRAIYLCKRLPERW